MCDDLRAEPRYDEHTCLNWIENIFRSFELKDGMSPAESAATRHETKDGWN